MDLAKKSVYFLNENKIYIVFAIICTTLIFVYYNHQERKKRSSQLVEKENERNIYDNDYINFLSKLRRSFHNDIYRSAMNIVDTIKVMIQKYGVGKTSIYLKNNLSSFSTKQDDDCYPFIFNFDLKKNEIKYYYHPNKHINGLRTLTGLRDGLLKTYNDDFDILNLLKRFENLGKKHKYGFLSYKWPSGMKESKTEDLIYKTTYIEKYKEYYICCDITYMNKVNQYNFTYIFKLLLGFIFFVLIWRNIQVDRMFTNKIFPLMLYLFVALSTSYIIYYAYQENNDKELIKEMNIRLEGVSKGILGLTLGMIILLLKTEVLRGQEAKNAVTLLGSAFFFLVLSMIGFLDKSEGYRISEYNYKYSLILIATPLFLSSVLLLIDKANKSTL